MCARMCLCVCVYKGWGRGEDKGMVKARRQNIFAFIFEGYKNM